MGIKTDWKQNKKENENKHLLSLLNIPTKVVLRQFW